MADLSLCLYHNQITAISKPIKINIMKFFTLFFCLVSLNTCFNNQNPDNRELLQAVKDNKVALVKSLLETTNPNCFYRGDGEPRSPLGAAAQSGNLEMANLLYAAGAKVTYKGEICKLLIEHGADVNGKVKGDGTPLLVAAKYGNVEVVSILLENGAEVDLAIDNDGNPLIMAAANNKLEVAKLLVAKGADVNFVIIGDESPLINAARFGHLGIVKFLVASGADVNLSARESYSLNAEVRTPLSMARKGEHTEIVAFLIQSGATK